MPHAPPSTIISMTSGTNISVSFLCHCDSSDCTTEECTLTRYDYYKYREAGRIMSNWLRTIHPGAPGTIKRPADACAALHPESLSGIGARAKRHKIKAYALHAPTDTWVSIIVSRNWGGSFGLIRTATYKTLRTPILHLRSHFSKLKGPSEAEH